MSAGINSSKVMGDIVVWSAPALRLGCTPCREDELKQARKQLQKLDEVLKTVEST
jgi:hypothetical protein